MPLQATSGAASYDAFGGGVPVVPKYIEEYFSTFLYTATGSAQTITNGIDLSTKGGLVWFKRRNTTSNHRLYDTARGMVSGTGGSPYLYSNDTAGNLGTGFAASVTASTTGFNITTDGGGIGDISDSGGTYTSWTLAKAPKFFDVVTYTGNGTSGRTVSHNLGSVPGCIIVKKTSSSSTYGWCVYHRSLTSGSPFNLCLNTTDSQGAIFNGDVYSATDTTFSVSSLADVNQSGQTFVAYLFAHDAGGFGLTGTDNVISCGSYTGTGATGNTITLGYEPQWVMIKRASGGTADWRIYDVMRNVGQLEPNTSDAEAGDPLQNALAIQATGFGIVDYTSGSLNANGSTYIYIAIRRGPMKVPTVGTSVFAPVTQTSLGTVTTGFPVDLMIGGKRSITHDTFALDRLRGSSTTSWAQLRTAGTFAEGTGTGNGIGLDNNTGFVDNWFTTAASTAYWNFRRSPSFFDEVCYTGGITSNPSHNLGVTPEMYIVKCRSSGTSDRGWYVYHSGYDTANNYILMNSSAGLASLAGVWSSGPTATTFGVENGYAVNDSGQTYVTYLFATCAGVSKVGEFSHLNGTATDVDCGFTSGARFILFKRYDDVGSWYVYDSARGIVSGNDPYLLLNSTAAEVTNTDFIDPLSSGFQVSSSFGTAGDRGFYIFLAIA